MKDLTILQVGVVFMCSLTAITWLKNDKLSAYWQQEYETSQPFEIIGNTRIGKMGQLTEQFVSNNSLEKKLINISQNLNETVNQIVYPKLIENDQLVSSQLVRKPKTQVNTQSGSTYEQDDGAVSSVISISSVDVSDLNDGLENELNSDDSLETLAPKMKPSDDKEILSSGNNSFDHSYIYLKNGKKVLFIGDSLMQGVAPWVMRKLQTEYNIDTMDLSKHSTGLTVSKFFDWPATVEKTLDKNADINALFVFLGGNDGQSILDPSTNRHIRFGSKRWDEIYISKINRILSAADMHNVQVLWVTPPKMKNSKLDKKTEHLIGLYTNNLPKNNVIILHSKDILKSKKNRYSDSMLINGRLTKVRTADGVHFTIKGQKVLATAMMNKIDINGQLMSNRQS